MTFQIGKDKYAQQGVSASELCAVAHDPALVPRRAGEIKLEGAGKTSRKGRQVSKMGRRVAARRMTGTPMAITTRPQTLQVFGHDQVRPTPRERGCRVLHEGSAMRLHPQACPPRSPASRPPIARMSLLSGAGYDSNAVPTPLRPEDDAVSTALTRGRRERGDRLL